MKIFLIGGEEFISEDGQRYDFAELSDEEKDTYEDAERVELAESVDFCRRSGDVQLSSSYIQIFADGSIFDEYEGSFCPVRITVED